ncbi:MAG: heat-inducible transcriptional repressor HrcA [Acidobacteriota bacterium]
MQEQLNDRERTILRSIIYSFIQTATPVGSRYIAKQHGIGLSPATVRNVMSDLEDLGYIGHPHTSSGRVPTDKGYRFYVDSLMEIEKLSDEDRSIIQSQLQSGIDQENLFRLTSKLIGAISHQLGVVSAPRLNTGILDKLELVPLSGTRILVVISIRSGLLKTITMEVSTEIPRTKLEDVSRMLNERLSGLLLAEIRSTLHDRMQDMRDEETGLIRLFIDSVDKLFDEQRTIEKVHIGGTSGILSQPEFEHADQYRSVIELLENEDMIVHVLEKTETKDGVIAVSIGHENAITQLKEYSIVTSTYSVGSSTGSVGIIGTKRMNYSKMIPLVDYVAKTISGMFSA